MWPELYINSKLVSLAPSVRHHHRHLHYHRYYYYDYYYYCYTKRAAPASATWNHLHTAGRTNPLSPGHPLPPRSPPLFALQPGGRRKLLEFSKSDVQDIMNEGMASSRRWRRWWSSNRGCLQRAGGDRGTAGDRWLGEGVTVVRRYPGKTTRLGSLFCLQNHPPAHSSSLNYIPT